MRRGEENLWRWTSSRTTTTSEGYEAALASGCCTPSGGGREGTSERIVAGIQEPRRRSNQMGFAEPGAGDGVDSFHVNGRLRRADPG